MLISYAILDPFRVLYDYERYQRGDTAVELNRDYIASELIKRFGDREGWDSFILGSSRSLAFLTSDWAQHLPGNPKPFHYDAAGETLVGVRDKVAWLRRHHRPIHHALFVADAKLLSGIVRRPADHPGASGQSALTFQGFYLRRYFASGFAIKHARYLVTGRVHPLASDVLDTHIVRSTWPGNDLLFVGADAEISRDGAKSYFDKRSGMFATQTPGTSAAVVGEQQRALLSELAGFLAGASVHVVVSPLWDQQKLNPSDLSALTDAFGADQVHDFSGVNEFTSDPYNYYDPSHHRPSVARSVMAAVYEQSRVAQ